MSSLNHNPIIKNIPLKDIKPYSNNPRKKQNITKVVNSIKEFGFQQPIVVDKKNIIIVGHSRYEAGKELGLDKPIISQYFIWISNILMGDFGNSVINGYPVFKLISFY